ncbi:methyl-accepting chemotaxis protein [Desulfobaculum sp. SPO524]|uniref:methyl-accepting chemotaxis protein n=1 Tax=Desulfobaculum sp. SPO524 TaxID=3378071 RepID=UPI0038520988
MANTSSSSSRTTPLLILGGVLSVLCLAAGALASLWAGIGAAVIGLILTAVLYLGAAKTQREAAAQADLAQRDIESYREEAGLLSRALAAAQLPIIVCADAETVWGASMAMAELVGADDPSELKGLPLRDVLGEELALSLAREGRAGSVDGTLHTTGKQVRVHIGRDMDTGVFALQMSDTTEIDNYCTESEQQRQQFKNAFASVNKLAQRLASSSELMSAHADEQAQGSRRQKEQTQAVAEAVEKLMEAVMEVAENATGTSQAAESARSEAADGVQLVRQAVDHINALSQSAKGLAEQLAELDNRTGEIGRIIGVINDIADQTNLLALNAAIEAARAGDAGRGFAVVADEVRKLAEKTMVATKEVESAIHTVQSSAKDAVESMDVTGKQVEQSTELSNSAGESLEKVMERIDDMVDRVAQIASAADAQSGHAEQISGSIDEIADIARDADEGASQQAYATRDLAKLSSELLTLAKATGEDGASSGFMLKEGEGMMKGVLPQLMHEFIEQKLGSEAFNAVQEELGEPTFLPTESYPDHVLTQMADIAAGVTGKSRDTIFRELGHYTIGGFHRMYKRYFKADNLKDFLLRMNDTHADVIKNMPGMVPPSFTIEDKGKVLFMNYHSKRALFAYFQGILEGAATFFKEKVDVKLKPLDAETARAEIHFKG